MGMHAINFRTIISSLIILYCINSFRDKILFKGENLKKITKVKYGKKKFARSAVVCSSIFIFMARPPKRLNFLIKLQKAIGYK